MSSRVSVRALIVFLAAFSAAKLLRIRSFSGSFARAVSRSCFALPKAPRSTWNTRGC